VITASGCRVISAWGETDCSYSRRLVLAVEHLAKFFFYFVLRRRKCLLRGLLGFGRLHCRNSCLRGHVVVVFFLADGRRRCPAPWRPSSRSNVRSYWLALHLYLFDHLAGARKLWCDNVPGKPSEHRSSKCAMHFRGYPRWSGDDTHLDPRFHHCSFEPRPTVTSFWSHLEPPYGQKNRLISRHSFGGIRVCHLSGWNCLLLGHRLNRDLIQRDRACFS